MDIYAIGDLHLSGDPAAKPMEIFGEHWQWHKEKTASSWKETVRECDAVIICGDISWAMQLREAEYDLNWIATLPGRKILLRGNHDYWWTGLQKMRQAHGDLEFLQNGCIMLGSTAICGSRGWVLPSCTSFTVEDEKIYGREGIRLELSLMDAKSQDAMRIIAALHYPPLFTEGEHSIFTDLLEKYGVTDCVFGHIHKKESKGCIKELDRGGIKYKLVSSDVLGFKLYKIT